ncbi:MAG: hypothetical protein AAF085_08135 [Planctomycetota bacterium]
MIRLNPIYLALCLFTLITSGFSGCSESSGNESKTEPNIAAQYTAIDLALAEQFEVIYARDFEVASSR